MPKVVVVGGGFAGCGAAASAVRAGARVTLLEATDDLGGLGLFGGSSRMSGQFTAHEEMIAMGGGDILKGVDDEVVYYDIELPGQHHVNMYNCQKIPARFHNVLMGLGVDVKYRSRVNKVTMNGNTITSVGTDDGREFPGEAFIDCTGTVGPQGNCAKYANGCVTCFIRCPTFGGRVSLTARAGVKESIGQKFDGSPGTWTAAFTVVKESIAEAIQKDLEKNGFSLMRIPEHLVKGCMEKLKLLAPSVTAEHATELTLTYMGQGKLGWVNVIGIPYMTREELRSVPGFEYAMLVQPYSSWVGNSVRYMAVAPRDEKLQVTGIDNLFVAGEKIGGQPNGVTEAATTGVVAGHNATRKVFGLAPVALPTSTVIGDFLAFTAQHQSDLNIRYSYIWGPYFERMEKTGLYTKNTTEIQKRVKEAGLEGAFAKKLG